MCDVARVKEKLQRALRRLYSEDSDLLSSKAHEQSVTSCLARHLQAEFPTWNVDCEYNRDARDQRDVKKDSDKTIRPDVIVHKRGPGNNLLAVEVKPYWSKEDRSADYAKLSHLTGPHFQYLLGAHIELNQEDSAIRWFKSGEATDEVIHV